MDAAEEEVEHGRGMCEKYTVRSFILALVFLAATLAWAEPGKSPKELEGVGVTEHLGDAIPLSDFHFTDETGKSVPFSDYFGKGKPVALALVYYECPNLCNLLLNGLFTSLQKLDWKAGQKFEFVAVSINPKEGPALAAKKRASYGALYGQEQGLHFLTSPDNQVQALANRIGFQYRYDAEQKQYMHTAAFFVLTPDGKISRYLYGISFQPKDLRFSLLDASSGRIGTVVDRVLLFCFHFDASKKGYTFQIWRAVQIVLGIQALIVIGMIFYLRRGEKKASQA